MPHGILIYRGDAAIVAFSSKVACMAYNEELAQRVRDYLQPITTVSEKRMFGGLAFLLNGNMLGGVRDHYLIVRFDKSQHADLMQREHVVPFSPNDKPFVGWAVVDEAGVDADRDLHAWLDRCVAFAKTLPKK